MRRIAVGLSWVALVACSSTDAERRAGAPAWSSRPVVEEAPPAAVASVDSGAIRVDEREAALRSALHGGGDLVATTLELVALLEGQERHEEALRVLDRSVTQPGSWTVLDVAAASLLRDLGRRGEALARLQFAQERDNSTFGPGLWFETAELAWLCGDYDAAAVAMRGMRATVEGAAFEKANEAEVEAMQRGVAQKAPPRSRKVRDLLGDLRGSEDGAHRLRVLRMLLEQCPDVAARACLIAAGDADPRLRVLAVERATVDLDTLPEFCAVALSDPDERVRAAGSLRAEALPAAERLTLLIPALAAESSPSAFAAIDARVCAAAGLEGAADERQASDAVFRSKTVEQRRRSVER